MTGSDIASLVLGESEEIVHTRDFAELEAATDHLVAQARRSVRILAHDTEPALYSRKPFTDLLARLISQNSQVASIRVLVADTARATQEPHRLVDLWHRFPSFVDFRVLREQYAKMEEAFIIADDIGIIRRPHHQNVAAVVTFRNVSTARERAAWFDEAWVRGAPCVALRRVTL